MTVTDGWYLYPGEGGAGWKLEVDFGTGWEAVTEWCAGGARQSGRRGPLDRFQASTLTVTLDNRTRDFSPWREGGFGTPHRNQPIRLTARTASGLEVVRFTGWIDRWVERALPGTRPGTVAISTVTVVATDGFKRLARANGLGTTPAGAGELSGARMTRILDEAAWDADARFVDDGEATMAETDLSARALEELHVTALAEGGVFFVNGAGVATFFDRASITASLDPVVRFGNDGGDGSVSYGELSIADTDEAIVNTIRVARAGGTEYTAVDSGGVTADGQLLFVSTSLPLEDDAQAEALAATLLSRAVNASFVVGPLEINPLTGGPVVWDAAVRLGVTNPVSVAHADAAAAGGFTLLARIDGITDRFGPGVWTTTYTVSALDEPDAYEVIGPPYSLTAASSYTSITWGWTIPGHGFDAIFVSFDSGAWVELPGDTDTYWTGGLDPGTAHTISVRGRKGLIDTGAVSLDADTADAPLEPDPDEDGEFYVPDPGAGCEWRWHLYALDATLGVTSISSGTFASLLGSYWRPTATYTPLTWYRLIWQKWCGTPKAQVGDDIVYDWQEPADWGDPCTFDTPPTPTPVWDLEVCPSTGSVQDAVTNFPMVERELFISPRPGPLETDVAALCGPGFSPAPVASGYLVASSPLGVQIPPILNPELTVGLWVQFDSEPLSECPLVTIGSDGEFVLFAFEDTADAATVRFGLRVKHPGGSVSEYYFDDAAGHDDEVAIDEWHSVAITWGWEGSDAKLRLYIDGLPVGTVFTLTGDWTVRSHDALVTWGGEPNSSFAHPAAWDEVLSEADVETIFGVTAPGPLDQDEFSGSGALASTDIRAISWTKYGSAAFTEDGTVRCSTAPMAWGGNGDIAFTDQGVADCVLTADIAGANLPASHGAGVSFRVGSSGVNGFIAFVYRGASGSSRYLYIQLYSGGSLTPIYGSGSSPNLGAGDVRLKVTLNGSSITVEAWNVAGTTLLDSHTFTNSTHESNTRHGIAAYNGTTTIGVIYQWTIEV